MKRAARGWLVAAAVLAGCGIQPTSSVHQVEHPATTTTTTEPPYDPTRSVKLEVEGSHTTGADLTIKVGDTESQQADLAVPVSAKGETEPGLTYKAYSGDFVYLSAQRKNDNSGTITCRISVNGVEVQTNTSSGPYTIATCSGTVP